VTITYLKFSVICKRYSRNFILTSGNPLDFGICSGDFAAFQRIAVLGLKKYAFFVE
jgi:hypothetical protein